MSQSKIHTELTPGYKIGMVTLVERVKRDWICVCECGNTTKKSHRNLLRSRFSSCGCKIWSDFNPRAGRIGERIGNLILVRLMGGHRWECQCDCGEKTIRRISNLRGRKTSSCGCHRYIKANGEPATPTWKGYKEISGKYFSKLQYNAKRTGKEFAVTIEHLWELFIQQNRKCKLSGRNITFCSEWMSGERNIEQTASLDRIDSNKDYIESNVQWLHKEINRFKNRYSQSEFISMCKEITIYN